MEESKFIKALLCSLGEETLPVASDLVIHWDRGKKTGKASFFHTNNDYRKCQMIGFTYSKP